MSSRMNRMNQNQKSGGPKETPQNQKPEKAGRSPEKVDEAKPFFSGKKRMRRILDSSLVLFLGLSLSILFFYLLYKHRSVIRIVKNFLSILN